ncbi:TPA: hypothetical protein IGZ91_003961 [Escherichia coli]|uniref:hypothetical protein n=1 Tax=Escherichia coli TaxID=562 RepID=UPI0015E19761|nr:hypothetical protein [Escherichia coli]HAW3134149.1 hypothetical protein [Escherichia coli]HBC1151666.1 hypothetical protein [Escherichia coli]
MKKFENITVLYVDEFDYANQEFLPEVVKAIDVADIVIRGKRIVKNRLACTSGAMTEKPHSKITTKAFVWSLIHLR